MQEKMLKITKKMLFWLWFGARIWTGREMYNDNRLCKGNGICELFLLQSRKMQLNQFKVKNASLRSHWGRSEVIKRASDFSKWLKNFTEMMVFKFLVI